MKKNLLITVIAAVLILFIASSCDLGETVTYKYTVPDWLANKGEFTTDTAADARADAEVGQKYFYGVSATSNTLTLIYKVKGEGATVESDRTVRYRQEDVPQMINSTYKGFPIITDPSTPNKITIAAYTQDNYIATMMDIERRYYEDITGEVVYLAFSFFGDNGIGGFRILK